MSQIHDLLIVGAGPAGLSAAVNAKARNLKALVLDAREPGAKVRTYPEITNYLGFPRASGAELAQHFNHHLSKTGHEFRKERVLKIMPQGGTFIATTGSGMYQGRVVILCIGVAQTAVLPGENQYLGKGVSYCVTCDGALFRGKNVVVVGYIPEGEEEANAVAGFARQVTYIATYPNVECLKEYVNLVHAQPTAIMGNTRARTLKTQSGEFHADGIFIVREAIPVNTLMDGLMTEKNFVCVTREMATNIPGVFAAGDCIGPPFQIAKAVGEGQVAALSAAKAIHMREKEG